MPVVAVASSHYGRMAALARRVASELLGLWRQVDRNDISRSWGIRSIDALVTLSAAQVLAASAASPYVTAALDAQGIDPAASGRLNPRNWAGFASDGRGLDTLLFEPAIIAKAALARGATIERAMASGGASLDMIARTQIADAGRTAVGASIVARRQATGFVRMLNPPSCSRCAILAGKRYRWNAGFDRHPRCDCIHIPSAEDSADDLRTDPAVYFGSLTPSEQDRLFTKAGAEAIRDGADIAQVVNARSGIYTAGGRSFTKAGATRSGLAGRRLNGGRRLTTEQIYRDAGNDRGAAIRLLKLHGYLL